MAPYRQVKSLRLELEPINLPLNNTCRMVGQSGTHTLIVIGIAYIFGDLIRLPNLLQDILLRPRQEYAIESGSYY